MEISLTFHCRNALLPLAHKHAVAGLIYHMLSSCQEYADMLHQQGYQAGGKQFKLFTFSDLIGRYQLQGKQLLYPEAFTLRVRSHDPLFIRSLLRSAATNRSYTLCANPLFLADYHVTDRPVTGGDLIIRTLSPITVHVSTADGKTRYFTPQEPEFSQAIARNALAKAQAYLGASISGTVEIAPDTGLNDRTRVVTIYKGTYITAWRGRFRLQGTPELLQFLYDTGLGSRSSQGFGMFEILKEEPYRNAD